MSTMADSVLVEGGERTPLLRVTRLPRDGSIASDRDREVDGPQYGAIGLSESPKA